MLDIQQIIQRAIRADQPESTKRLIALVAAGTLCLCAFGLTLTIEVQATQTGKVDAQLAWITAGAYMTVAGLAGVAYRKSDIAPAGAVSPGVNPLANQNPGGCADADGGTK